MILGFSHPWDLRSYHLSCLFPKLQRYHQVGQRRSISHGVKDLGRIGFGAIPQLKSARFTIVSELRQRTITSTSPKRMTLIARRTLQGSP